MTARNETFWVVWNPSHGQPNVRHGSEHSAINEAKRLASLNGGQQFFVLMATHTVRKPEPVEVIQLDVIPF